MVPPASLDPPLPASGQGRHRPFIYVYDMAANYTTRILQHKLGADSCMWRRFDGGNNSYTLAMTYR